MRRALVPQDRRRMFHPLEVDAVLGTVQGHAAEQFRLVLVGGEIGHGGKQVGGQGRRGSRIEHHRHPGGTGHTGRRRY